MLRVFICVTEPSSPVCSRLCRYAVEHGHSQTDLAWLFGTRKGQGKGSNALSKHRGAWQTIAEALPQRNPSSVWSAGTRMLHPDHYKVSWGSGLRGYNIGFSA